MIALVYSKQDPAGSGTAAKISELAGVAGDCEAKRAGATCMKMGVENALLIGFNEDVLDFWFLDEAVPSVEAYIVLSRHSAASGKPTLSLHYPGNPFPEPSHGARARELAWTWPLLFKLLATSYYRLARERGLLEQGYEFTLEATHHGPTNLARPVIFIEIGSTPKQWVDGQAQRAMAEAVLDVLKKLSQSAREAECRPAIGVGDTHYPKKHTKLILESDLCYGHIFAKYALEHLDEEILVQAVHKSVQEIEAVVLAKVPSRVSKTVKHVAGKLGLDVVS
jgi:D-aminoacyl-tRNA deacylase